MHTILIKKKLVYSLTVIHLEQDLFTWVNRPAAL